MNIESSILEAIQDCATQFPDIQCIKLFGSRVRGDNSPKSDIDLAIYGLADLSELTYALDLYVPTLLTFDLSNMTEEKDAYFKAQVENEGVLIYEKSHL